MKVPLFYANANASSYRRIYHFISAPGGHIQASFPSGSILHEQASPIVTRE